ncbi:MAG: Clp protease N-terminal domain-containing protein [Streptosporangiaceae bacterium]
MFERFTDKARRVLVLAQEEASQLGHGHIGTEHFLLGLLHEGDGVAARALASLGIGLRPARDLLEADAGPGLRQSAHIPFTPEAKRTLEFSLREALHLGHDYIGTEHILLALVRDSATRAARMLTELGATPQAVRQRVLEIVPARGAGQAQRTASSAGRVLARGDPWAGYGALSSRLAALERWVGLVPDLADLDEQIAQVHRDIEAAIDAREFRSAEALSDSEHELIAERDRRSRQRRAGPALADQVARLQAEVDRLQEALRRHGIDPGGDA